ncbi:unnamed protein product [Pedinophyceae sp. YPF-701]|nr:unnamed protein product [Pedinophyceae sp. YPF-701]
MYGTPDAHGQLRDIYLNEAAQALGTARRRLYDIINVLSAVEVVARTGKLTYVWRGTAHLPQLMQSLVHEELHGMPAVRPTKQEPYDPYLLLPSPAESKHPSPCSLWTLARKFVRLLLARGAQQPLLLSEAAGLLSGDGAVGRRAAKSQQIITVERRLYDVCSILCTMGLVEKVQLGRRQPAYRWSFVPQGGAQPAPRGAAPSGAVPSANTGSCQFTADGARVGGGGNGAQQQAMMATLMSDPLLASLNPAALQAMVDVMMSHGNNAGTNSNGTNTHSGPPGHAHVAAPPRPAPPAPPLPSEFQAVETLLQQVIGLVPPAGPAPSGLSSGPNGAPSSAPTGSTGGLPQAPELLQQLIAVLEALAAPPRSTGPDPSLALVQALIALGSSSGIPPPSSPDEMAALFGTLPVLLQTLQSLGDGNSAGNNGAATPMPAQSQQQQSSGGLSHSMGQMPLPAWAQRPPASLPPPSSISNPSVSGQKRNSQSYGGSGNPLASSPPAPQPAQLAHFAHLAQQAQHRGGHPTQQAQHHPHAHAYHPHPPQPPKPQGAHGGANDFMQAAVQLLASQLPPGTDPAALLAAMGLPGMTSPASSAPSAHRSGQATPAMGPPASSGPPPASAPPPPPAHAPAQHTHAHRPEDDANVTALMQAMLGVFGSFAPAPRPQ